ncbi:MAG: ECF transporter S component [Clostridia bacterium]|nr:ECF transporter S component [Clostridia bacterium]
MPAKPVTRRGAVTALLLLGFLLSGAALILLEKHSGGRRYYLTAAIIVALALLPFALSFERRYPSARELAVLAVMIAMAVAARAAFYALPSVKPLGAIVVVTAVCLGPQTGFLTGAAAMLISNFIFGQGQWTPFQMLGMGAVGLAAGFLFRIRALRENRILLALGGGLLCLVLYGGIVDLSTVLIYSDEVTWEKAAAIYATGLPFNLIHAGTMAAVLLLAGKPLIEKLERIKIKYGLFQQEKVE